MELPKSHQQKLVKACAEATLEAVRAFPDLLARSSPESAAAIVALLLRDRLAGSSDQPETLEDIIRRMAETDSSEA